MANSLPLFLQSPEPETESFPQQRIRDISFVDKTLHAVARFFRTTFIQMDTASKSGFFQSFQARTKVLFLIVLIVSVSFIHQINKQLVISGLVVLLFFLSNISILAIYKRIGFIAFVFGFVVVAPASLNVFHKGAIIFTIVNFNTPHRFWIYHLPTCIGITDGGCSYVFLFFLRVFNSVSVSFLVFYTTSFNDIVKSLKMLRVPDLFLMVVMLSWKFLFVLMQTVEESYLAMKLRWWNRTRASEARQIVAGRVLHIFRRAWAKYDEMYKAMVARGYTGKVSVSLYAKMKLRDFVMIGASIVFMGLLLWF